MRHPPSAKDYLAHYTRLRNRLLFRWVDTQKRSILRRFVAAGQRLRVLDLGCGTGSLSKNLTGNRVYGLDHDMHMVICSRANGLVACQASIEQLPFLNGTFDVVLMVDSIEHVTSRNDLAREVTRVLTHDGFFVAITPRYESLFWLVAERVANLIAGQQPGHISPFTTESLTYFMATHFINHRVGRLNIGMWLYGVGGRRVGRHNPRRERP